MLIKPQLAKLVGYIALSPNREGTCLKDLGCGFESHRSTHSTNGAIQLLFKLIKTLKC